MNGGRSTPRDQAIEDHLPLVRRLAHRFAQRGEEMDDLVQVGAIGLINAVDRFEPSRGVSFASYAVPCIVGEMQRHLRDRTHVVRVPRRVQEDRVRLRTAEAEITGALGRRPRHGEIAEAAGLDEARADRTSAHDPTPMLLADVADALGSEIVDESELAMNRVAVGVALNGLRDGDQELVRRRFFEDLSQDEIALELGISQVQVSRLLRSCLDRLRVELDDRVVVGRSERA